MQTNIRHRHNALTDGMNISPIKYNKLNTMPPNAKQRVHINNILFLTVLLLIKD